MDVEYCKFQGKCRKSHSSSICQDNDYGRKCPQRLHKECQFKEKCKFIKKSICALSHAYGNSANSSLEKIIKNLKEVLLPIRQKVMPNSKFKRKSIQLERFFRQC
jgi:hypothetical protein